MIPFKVVVEHLEMQDDKKIDLGLLTLNHEEGFFDLKEKPIMPYEKKDDVWFSVTVERDLDLIQHERFIYTFFDFLSDIGGLSGMLFTILATASAMINYKAFDKYMATRLFKIKKP